MGLRNFIARRIIYSFILIILVIGVNFLIFMKMPGDPTDFLMAAWSRESPQQRQAHEGALKDLWGIGDPWHIQFAKYLRNLVSWNFGVEIAGRRPVGLVMAQKIPYTVLLLGSSILISIVIGVILGIFVIQRRGGLFDSSALGISLILNSLPTFWLGLILLWVFSNTLRWFPGSHAFPAKWALVGTPQPFTVNVAPQITSLATSVSFDLNSLFALVGGYVSHLILPMTTLTLFFFGGWLLLTRATMLETITEDYVLTARAKGLNERSILYKHAFRNASLPIITSAAMSFGFILSGAIITETVFSYPGLGGWIWTAISLRDYTVLMAIFYVISLCVIIANIVADLLYGVIDPRIKYG